MRGRWRRARTDVQHEIAKARRRAARRIRQPSKQLSESAGATTMSSGQAASEVRQTPTAMRASGRRTVAGPWIHETVFEPLCWMPFLRRAQKHGNLVRVASLRCHGWHSMTQRTFRDVEAPPCVALRPDDVGVLETLLGPEQVAAGR